MFEVPVKLLVPDKLAFVAIKLVMVVLKLASLLIAVANSDNVFNKSGLELTRFAIWVLTYVWDAIFDPLKYATLKQTYYIVFHYTKILLEYFQVKLICL